MWHFDDFSIYLSTDCLIFIVKHGNDRVISQCQTFSLINLTRKDTEIIKSECPMPCNIINFLMNDDDR